MKFVVLCIFSFACISACSPPTPEKPKDMAALLVSSGSIVGANADGCSIMEKDLFAFQGVLEEVKLQLTKSHDNVENSRANQGWGNLISAGLTAGGGTGAAVNAATGATAAATTGGVVAVVGAMVGVLTNFFGSSQAELNANYSDLLKSYQGGVETIKGAFSKRNETLKCPNFDSRLALLLEAYPIPPRFVTP